MSRQSANDKGDNEMIPVAAHRSPGIYLTADEIPGKAQLRDSLMKVVWPVIASNEVPNDVSRIAQYVKEGDGAQAQGALGTWLINNKLNYWKILPPSEYT